jgi:aldehyde dehydrogenase (NAD(P)+)
VGGGGPGVLPWTLVTGLDSGSDDPAFRTEPFCAILSETTVASEDPVEYLAQAVEFVNARVWGTLCAHVVVHPRTQRDPGLAGAFERALTRLRYGTVAVNAWCGYGFGAGTTPWGAYPGASLTDIQSGRGFVHNTRMLEKVEKTVIRHPARTFPKPVYFPSHRTVEQVGKRLVALEAKGSWLEMPGLVGAAVRG